MIKTLSHLFLVVTVITKNEKQNNSFLLPTGPLSMVSVNSSQLWSKNIKWKIPDIEKKHQILN